MQIETNCSFYSSAILHEHESKVTYFILSTFISLCINLSIVQYLYELSS